LVHSGLVDALDEKWFMGHSLQLTEFAGAYLPAPQKSQAVPGMLLNIFTGQAVQLSLPTPASVPAGHGKHGLPAAEK
jgi:hypothetical protein